MILDTKIANQNDQLRFHKGSVDVNRRVRMMKTSLIFRYPMGLILNQQMTSHRSHATHLSFASDNLE